MKKKELLTVIGVACIAVMSLSVLVYAATWTPEQMADWMYRVGKPKIWKILRNTNEMKPMVEDIQDKIGTTNYALDKLDVEALSFEFAANPGSAGFAYIYVAVSFGGEGVTGLTAANFALHTRHVPPGYWAIDIESVHVNWGTGTYTLRVKPHAPGVWGAGDYGSELWVTYGTKKGVTLVLLTVT